MIAFKSDKVKYITHPDGVYHLGIRDADKILVVRHEKTGRVLIAEANKLISSKTHTASWLNHGQCTGSCLVKGEHAAPHFIEV